MSDMKDYRCPKCGKWYVGHHGGKCPSCILKAKQAKDKKEKESKKAQRAKSVKKVTKRLSRIHKNISSWSNAKGVWWKP